MRVGEVGYKIAKWAWCGDQSGKRSERCAAIGQFAVHLWQWVKDIGRSSFRNCLFGRAGMQPDYGRRMADDCCHSWLAKT